MLGVIPVVSDLNDPSGRYLAQIPGSSHFVNCSADHNMAVAVFLAFLFAYAFLLGFSFVFFSVGWFCKS